MVVLSGTITHTDMGRFRDGKKVVFSEISVISGTTSAPFVVPNLTRILSYTFGVKNPGMTNGAVFTVTTSGWLTSGTNVVYVAASAAAYSGVVTLMTIGE
jgi:hypothetical protein